MYKIPQTVLDYVKKHFANCNAQLSRSLSLFPGIREESLDNNFIAYFANIGGPVRVDSNWTVRFEAHFIGGGRHYFTWEVADIGLMVIFRQKGKIIRSKMAFLQSKKLYADNTTIPSRDPYGRMGMGRLLDTEEEHKDIIRVKELIFKESSKYKAFKKDSEQQDAMSSFQRRFKIDMYYLFYNPVSIPHSIVSPLERTPELGENKVGCRVVSKDSLDDALQIHAKNYVPSYGDITYMLSGAFVNDEHKAGWRFEYFIVDLLIGCKEGLIDDSPNFGTLQELLYQKSSPISAALSITVDLEELFK
jgi:hypothetical protein